MVDRIFNMISVTQFLWECILATRPYSFTAVIVPIVITTAIVSSPSKPSSSLLDWAQIYCQEGFLRALLMGIAVQSGANLTNTCMYSMQ